MLRKAKSEPPWMQIYDVPRKAGNEITAAFGHDKLLYDPHTETLSLPSRMRDVTWEEYDALLDALPDHRLRHTYDRGFLEIMSPSDRHEKLAHVIGRFIEEMSWSIGVRVESFRSATRRRRSLRRGLQPDETYFIANEPSMRGRFDYNPERDPPPDLVIEVDLRRPSKRRMDIYAALQVPEIWIYDGKVTRFLALQEGDYRNVAHSLAVSNLNRNR
ncbi:MAG TPA: Uma2 family endonuclease [Candidatus Kapabacteria bacterium]|nr:Uma2 family endonuclease [Candidatus Kapabacteria bacterium]